MNKFTKYFFICSFILYILFIISLIVLQITLPNDLKFSFSLIGKVPLCNRQKDRAPIIGNFVFPLCWRCFSILISYSLSFLIFNIKKIKAFINKNKIIYLIIVILLLSLPMILDGGLEYLFNIESTNIRRIITGSCFGISISIMSIRLIYFLFDKSLSKSKNEKD